MTRNRDYKAEYARRKARSQSRYGVSYGEFRSLQSRAKEAGISPESFRRQAFKEGTVSGNLNRLKTVLNVKEQARDEYRDFGSGGLPDTEGRRDMQDLYDAWHDSFDDEKWFFYH